MNFRANNKKTKGRSSFFANRDIFSRFLPNVQPRKKRIFLPLGWGHHIFQADPSMDNSIKLYLEFSFSLFCPKRRRDTTAPKKVLKNQLLLCGRSLLLSFLLIKFSQVSPLFCGFRGLVTTELKRVRRVRKLFF